MNIAIDVKALAAELAAAMPERLPKLLSLPQVAEVLACSSKHVQSLIAAGELVAIDISNGEERQALRVTSDSLREFAERRRVA